MDQSFPGRVEDGLKRSFLDNWEGEEKEAAGLYFRVQPHGNRFQLEVKYPSENWEPAGVFDEEASAREHAWVFFRACAAHSCLLRDLPREAKQTYGLS